MSHMQRPPKGTTFKGYPILQAVCSQYFAKTYIWLVFRKVFFSFFSFVRGISLPQIIAETS